MAALLAARDLRSSIGSNLAVFREESGLTPWTYSMGQLRAALMLAEEVPAPPEDAWRVLYTGRLLEERLHYFYTADTKEEQRVQDILDSLVTN